MSNVGKQKIKTQTVMSQSDRVYKTVIYEDDDFILRQLDPV